MPGAAKSLGGLVFLMLLLCTRILAQGPPVLLKDLIDEAIKSNPEILSADARAASISERISQAASLADPMLSFGYQNEGLSEYNYGESPDAQWMFSLSQTFAFPGKLFLQGEAARLEAQAESENAEAVKRRIIGRVSEAYYDLLLVTKELDLIQARKPLANNLEEAALARYAAGAGSQEEVIMAQVDKYMLIEKEEMAKRRRESIEAMLGREIGRGATATIGRPADSAPTPFTYTLEELLDRAVSQSPELTMQRSLMQASEKRLLRSRREALPDVTLMASYTSRNGPYKDMYALTASVPLPVFYTKKQGAGTSEATWNLVVTRKDLEANRLKIESEIRDNLAMIKASDRVMELYKSALIPKARQDIDAALAQYASGRMETSSALAKLKAPFDYELITWQQYVEREKAIARIKALTGEMEGQ
jgi:cobalt-zinc-cadmium efflux system outer membrane protein